MIKNKKWKLLYWFTLVELIIVITILTVLATIAFIGFKKYIWNARDGNRIATVKNIQKWLDLYQIKVWKYPPPEWEVSQWYVNGTLLVQKWQIQQTIVKQINMNSVPLDPETKNYYIYGVTTMWNEYQLATILNSQIGYHPFISPVYANTSYVKVEGNYKWFLKYEDICTTYINTPSLLWWNTSDVNLLQTWSTSETPLFIVNNGKNLPYTQNSVLPEEIIQFLRNSDDATLITICEEELKNLDTSENKEKIITSFWVSEEEIKTKILWDSSAPIYASCSGTPHGQSKNFWSISQVEPGNTCSTPVNYICDKWEWKLDWVTQNTEELFWSCIVWDNNCTLTNNWGWIILSNSWGWCYLF